MTNKIDPAYWPDRLAGVAERLNGVLELAAGWDGSDAQAPELSPCIGALHVLWDSLAPEPDTVLPTRQGGVKLAWHRPSSLVTMCVNPDANVGIQVLVTVKRWFLEDESVPLGTFLGSANV